MGGGTSAQRDKARAISLALLLHEGQRETAELVEDIYSVEAKAFWLRCAVGTR
jgi:hypothetical protein